MNIYGWNFKGAWEYLSKGRDPKGKGRPMAKATRLQYRGIVSDNFECIALRYWNTDVVRWYRSLSNKSNMWVSIDAQYDTRTTNDRISQYTSLHTQKCKATGYRVIQRINRQRTYDDDGKYTGYSETVIDETPLIADHMTWFRADGHVKHYKRCQKRYKREIGEYNLRKNNNRVQYENVLSEARTKRLNIVNGYAESKMGMALNKLKNKTPEQVRVEMEQLRQRKAWATSDAMRIEKHHAELEDKIKVGYTLLKMEGDMKAQAKILECTASFPAINAKMKSLEKKQKNLEAKVNVAEDLWKLQRELTNSKRNFDRLLKDKNKLEEEIGYLLGKKEGTNADAHTSVLNRL